MKIWMFQFVEMILELSSTLFPDLLQGNLGQRSANPRCCLHCRHIGLRRYLFMRLESPPNIYICKQLLMICKHLYRYQGPDSI